MIVGPNDAMEANAASTASECPNCGHDRPERYCPRCGQSNREFAQSIWPVVGEFFRETFGVDSRLPRTLKLLLFQPGHLTVEFSRSRRANYVSPVRLYLISNIVVFLLLSWMVPRLMQAGSTSFELGFLSMDVVEIVARTIMAIGLLPYGLALALCYRRKRLYLVQHIVYGMHIEAWKFVVFGVASSICAALLVLTGSSAELIGGLLFLSWFVAVAGQAVYNLFAMRRFYGHGWTATLVRWFLVSFLAQVLTMILLLVLSGFMIVLGSVGSLVT